MTTKRKPKAMKYLRYMRAQVALLARKLQKKYKAVTRTTAARKKTRAAAKKRAVTKTTARKVVRKTASKTKAKHSSSITKTMKKDIQKLKQLNSFMRRQVAKFRKDVLALKRKHLATSGKASKKVSNVFSFKAAAKKRHRKAG